MSSPLAILKRAYICELVSARARRIVNDSCYTSRSSSLVGFALSWREALTAALKFAPGIVRDGMGIVSVRYGNQVRREFR